MSTTLTYSGTLRVTSCWCGISMAVPQSLFDAAYNDAQTIYCPLGHMMTWKQTEAQRLANQLERANRRARAERDLREHTENKLRAQKGATTKAKKRHAAGVCPACNRTFQQLVRHMESQHPDYEPSAHA